jgi:hypothetical protein
VPRPERWKIQFVFRCLMRWCLSTPGCPKYILPVDKGRCCRRREDDKLCVDRMRRKTMDLYMTDREGKPTADCQSWSQMPSTCAEPSSSSWGQARLMVAGKAAGRRKPPASWPTLTAGKPLGQIPGQHFRSLSPSALSLYLVTLPASFPCPTEWSWSWEAEFSSHVTCMDRSKMSPSSPILPVCGPVQSGHPVGLDWNEPYLGLGSSGLVESLTIIIDNNN